MCAELPGFVDSCVFSTTWSSPVNLPIPCGQNHASHPSACSASPSGMRWNLFKLSQIDITKGAPPNQPELGGHSVACPPPRYTRNDMEWGLATVLQDCWRQTCSFQPAGPPPASLQSRLRGLQFHPHLPYPKYPGLGCLLFPYSSWILDSSPLFSPSPWHSHLVSSSFSLVSTFHNKYNTFWVLTTLWAFLSVP